MTKGGSERFAFFDGVQPDVFRQRTGVSSGQARPPQLRGRQYRLSAGNAASAKAPSRHRRSRWPLGHESDNAAPGVEAKAALREQAEAHRSCSGGNDAAFRRPQKPPKRQATFPALTCHCRPAQPYPPLSVQAHI